MSKTSLFKRALPLNCYVDDIDQSGQLNGWVGFLPHFGQSYGLIVRVPALYYHDCLAGDRIIVSGARIHQEEKIQNIDTWSSKDFKMQSLNP